MERKIPTESRVQSLMASLQGAKEEMKDAVVETIEINGDKNYASTEQNKLSVMNELEAIKESVGIIEKWFDIVE